MSFSTVTVSFPVDSETFEEMLTLCNDAAQADGVQYGLIMNLQAAKNYEMSGFCVLAYDDEHNKLVGLASAIDMMGLHTYEWSIVVAPAYRKLGIGQSLLQEVYNGLSIRGAEGELALTLEQGPFGAEFLKNNGYRYSFSEATLQGEAQAVQQPENIEIRRYQGTDQQMLIETFMGAFGDTEEEAQDLIAYNTTSENLILWVAVMEDTVVGTVTTREEGAAQWLTALAVHPQHERQGIGSALLNWVRQLAYDCGQQHVLLDVEIDNARALSIYEKAGFIKVMQIDYYVYVKEA
ncbi:GNAT family N-acetyltransferase [Bacillus ndiopicus]|uniref:GNAT family N-acetyltransferase n=1 Tax=Bacillus ndiopicus TaxID=1347368 RepID=UPI0005A99F69|nr:GNAT family N-acetyltransferase [Bacillus ndiopicus]